MATSHVRISPVALVALLAVVAASVALPRGVLGTCADADVNGVQRTKMSLEGREDLQEQAPCHSENGQEASRRIQPVIQLTSPGKRRRPTKAASPTKLCFERVDDKGDALNLVGHPQGNGYALIGTQAGLISLVHIPKGGRISYEKVFLDLTGRALFDGERGLLSFAFHPEFIKNGRFFVSYICDGSVHSDCQGKCSCVPATGCDPTVKPKTTCNSNTIIAEYHVPHPTDVNSVANPEEVHRYMTYGRPFSTHDGGHMVFGLDGKLYIASGDGGHGGDPWNFAQKLSSYLGKILRIDVDDIPTGAAYGIPKDNPFVHMPNALPEIYALGLRNPWRMAVDPVTGAIFLGDCGEDNVEEVDRLESGSNYGWHNFEGTSFFKATDPTPGGFFNVSQLEGKLTFPVFEYTSGAFYLPGVPRVGGRASVIGGVVYRAPRNKCLQGKYIYNDMFGPMWAGTVFPEDGENAFTTAVKYSCSPDTPIACLKTAKGGVNFGAIMWSWGVDSSGDVFLMSTNGIYRITDLDKCGATCP